ncbi:MAG: hypothetical protein AB1422_09520 [bacterium]
MEISSTGTGEIRLKPAATSLPESRTPSPESRFSEEPFSLITDRENGHGLRIFSVSSVSICG